jgi:hypothetical protein
MKSNLFHYVIKNEEGAPTGYPISIENLLQILGLSSDTRVNLSLILDNGYFPFNLVQTPQDTTRQQVQDNGFVIGTDGYVESDYAMVEKAFADTDMTAILNEKLDILKQGFEVASKRPEVDTGLGFSVDGSHADLQNFKLGQDIGLLSVIDSEGISQTITVEDYATIITAIQVANVALMQTKWDTKALLQGVDLQSPTALASLDAIEIPFQVKLPE